MRLPSTSHPFLSAHERAGAVNGFTLIEVILAIVIAVAIFVVALYFYNQSANLRDQVIRETESISAIRLLMDRVTGELRSIPKIESSRPALIGQSNQLQFVRTSLPSQGQWSGAALGRSTFPETDLKIVTYRLEVQDLTNVLGLIRLDEPLVESRALGSSEVPISTNIFRGTNDLTLLSTNLPMGVIELVRFLQFRYWNGTAWVDGWTTFDLPQAVEVSMAGEDFSTSTNSAEMAEQIFTRVIYLPGSKPVEPMTRNNFPGYLESAGPMP